MQHQHETMQMRAASAHDPRPERRNQRFAVRRLPALPPIKRGLLDRLKWFGRRVGQAVLRSEPYVSISPVTLVVRGSTGKPRQNGY